MTMKNTDDNHFPIASTWIAHEADQEMAAAFLSEPGGDITAGDLLRLAARKAGPEHRRVGANLIYAEDALLKFASTVERVVARDQATIDDPQIE
jgi:hypothetical protein